VIYVKASKPSFRQQSLFSTPAATPSKFISTFRVSLVQDTHLPFEKTRLNNSSEAHPIIRRLIQNHGQPDREQFCVLMLNAKNAITGVNIVATGTVTAAQVCPREVLKPAILTNATGVIFAHNHPSGDVNPSVADIAVTKTLVDACRLLGIQVHEHLIVSMFDEHYYSFADHGLIKQFYDQPV
jgi:DNA repair protein RadC